MKQTNISIRAYFCVFVVKNISRLGAHLTFLVALIFLVYGGRYLFYRFHSYLSFHFPSFRLSTSLSPSPPLFSLYPYLSFSIGLFSRSPIYIISDISFPLSLSIFLLLSYILCTCAAQSYFIFYLHLCIIHPKEKTWIFKELRTSSSITLIHDFENISNNLNLFIYH